MVGALSTSTSLALPTTYSPILSPLWMFFPLRFGWSRSIFLPIPALWTSVMMKYAGEVVCSISRRYGGCPSLAPASFPVIRTAAMMMCSGGLAEVSKRMSRGVVVWFVWSGLGFFPELVPVVFGFFSGVGSSVVFVLTVGWSARVKSGWAIFLLFVCTGLLYGFFLWCHVIFTVKRLRSGVEFGSFAMPKGVVDFGVSLIPKGVTYDGPFGIIFLLILLSGLFSRGFNPCSALCLDVLTVVLYVTIVYVIVYLTLIIYHMFIVALL